MSRKTNGIQAENKVNRMYSSLAWSRLVGLCVRLSQLFTLMKPFNRMWCYLIAFLYLVSDGAVDGDERPVERTFKDRQTVINIEDVDENVDCARQKLMDGRVTSCNFQTIDWLTLVVQRSAIHPQRPETEVFWGDLTKTAVTVVCFGRFNWSLAFRLLIANALLT